MPILTFVHDEHFDLLAGNDAPEGVESEGTYTVLTREGEEEERGKYRLAEPANTTTVELPDEPMSLTELVGLLDVVAERHTDAITGVRGSDPAFTAKVAGLLDVPVLDDEEVSA